MAMTGHISAMKSLAKLANIFADRHNREYGDDIPLGKLCEELSSLVHTQTVSGSSPHLSRAVLVGHDSMRGYQVFTLDIDGSYHSWHAVALGRHETKMKSALADMISRRSIIESSLTEALAAIKTQIIDKFFTHLEDTLDVNEWSVDVCIGTLDDEDEDGVRAMVWTHPESNR